MCSRSLLRAVEPADVADAAQVPYTSATMSRPKVIILRTAGTNCDQETAHAWELAGANVERVHVRELIAHPDRLQEASILTIPGGFSYGDDISAGKILAVQVIRYLSEAIASFIEAGKLVLGICNGFQVLVKAGLLPGGSAADESANGVALSQPITLTQNDSARFEDRWVCLHITQRASAFLPNDTILAMPIAHAEGKLVTAGDMVRHQLVEQGHIALTYCDLHGEPGGYPINPNGSELHIAGLTDATGRILGLMPHPERYMHGTQHPTWTRWQNGLPDGRIVFETAVATARDL